MPHQNQSISLKADVEGFDTLVDLALNLRWSWSHMEDKLLGAARPGIKANAACVGVRAECSRIIPTNEVGRQTKHTESDAGRPVRTRIEKNRHQEKISKGTHAKKRLSTFLQSQGCFLEDSARHHLYIKDTNFKKFTCRQKNHTAVK